MNDRASGQWMECKVGASFSQRVVVSRGRVWLVGKRSYASIEGAEAFGEKFFLDCVNRGGVLDVWHLERELKRALGEGRRLVVEELKGLALEGKGREILQRLMVEGSKVKGAEEREDCGGDELCEEQFGLDCEYCEGAGVWDGAGGEDGGYCGSSEI